MKNCEKPFIINMTQKSSVFQIFDTYSILAISSAKQKRFEKLFLVRYLESKALQILKISSKSEVVS